MVTMFEDRGFKQVKVAIEIASVWFWFNMAVVFKRGGGDTGDGCAPSEAMWGQGEKVSYLHDKQFHEKPDL